MEEINYQEHIQPKQKKVLIVGSGGISQRTTEIINGLKSDSVEVVEVKDLKENGLSLQDIIIDNSDLISEQASYPIHIRPPALPTVNYRNDKRTDENRLKEYGIDSLDKLLEECILISQKQSKLPRSIRDIIVRTSIQAFKELNVKAEEIKKESLENNTKEDDRKEQ